MFILITTLVIRKFNNSVVIRPFDVSNKLLHFFRSHFVINFFNTMVLDLQVVMFHRDSF
jgi:hypothetical protein